MELNFTTDPLLDELLLLEELKPPVRLVCDPERSIFDLAVTVTPFD
jgi:hypothetical protein